jgi:hypothetical protein
MNFWAGIGEWIHEAGWLAFWIAMAVWFVNRHSIATAAGAKALPTSTTTTSAPAPKLEITTSGYPLRVDPASTTTLIAWRNKFAPDEGGKVDLVRGSIHVELWNSNGTGRTGKTRLVKFS